jgi:HEAT repeat protein
MSSYPPGQEEAKQLFEELVRLDNSESKGFDNRKYELIHDIAEAHYFQAKDYFLLGLDNPDPDYRWACISALATLWRITDAEFTKKIMGLAETDPDLTVRDIAIDSLGRLKIKEAFQILMKIAKNEAEMIELREKAAISVLRIRNIYPKGNRNTVDRKEDWISRIEELNE